MNMTIFNGYVKLPEGIRYHASAEGFYISVVVPRSHRRTKLLAISCPQQSETSCRPDLAECCLRDSFAPVVVRCFPAPARPSHRLPCQHSRHQVFQQWSDSKNLSEQCSKPLLVDDIILPFIILYILGMSS